MASGKKKEKMMKRMTTPTFTVATGRLFEMRLTALLVPLLLLGGCLDSTSRSDSGICYEEEHLNDHDNCACEGPCAEGTWCVDGTCKPICDGGTCSPFCGNGECEPQYGEDCYSCPGDCGCDEEVRYRLQPEVIVISDGSALSFVAEDEKGVLLFEAESETAALSVIPGSIIIAGPSFGRIYVRVLVVETVGKQISVLEYDVPTLIDVFQEAEVKVSRPVDFANIEVDEEMRSRLRIRPPEKADWFGKEFEGVLLDSAGFNLDGLVFFDAAVSNAYGNSVHIKLDAIEGSLEISSDLIWEHSLTAKRLKLAIDPTVKINVVLRLTVSGAIKLKEWETKKTKLFWVPVPIIPFVLWIDIPFKLQIVGGLDFAGATEISAGFNTTIKGIVGATYENGKWTEEIDLERNTTPIMDFAQSLGLGAKLGLRCLVELDINSVVGPYLFLTPYIKLLAELKSNPLRVLWELLFGIDVGIGFDISILGWDIVDFNVSWPILAKKIAGGEYILEDCGDGKLNGQESCDGDKRGGKNCKSLGFDSGTLKCTDDCKFDTSKCCKAEHKKKCDGKKLYYFDSCEVQGEVADSCDDENDCTSDYCKEAQCKYDAVNDGQTCADGQCKDGKCEGCNKGASQKCVDGDLYSYDSCGEKGDKIPCDDTNLCTIDFCGNDACDYSDVAKGTPCGAGKVCIEGVCADKPDCLFDEECDAVCGDYSECSGFDSVCDESGTYKRSCTEQVCVGGVCVLGSAKTTETDECKIDTDSFGCGEKNCGEWGECGEFEDECDEVGLHYRSCTGSSCVAGTCKPNTQFNEPGSCPRITDGLVCGVATECGGWGDCTDFEHVCDNSGTRYKSCKDFHCSNSACESGDSYQVDEPCSRDTKDNKCKDPLCGGWGACGGFTGECDSSGTWSRSCTPYACANESCDAGPSYSEPGSCTVGTDGKSCGGADMVCKGDTCIDPECTGAGDCDPDSCGFVSSCTQDAPGTCSTSGHRTEECTSYNCVAYVCQPSVKQNQVACVYSTEDNECGDAQCGPYGACVYVNQYCSETGTKEKQCTGKKCSGGQCAPSAPYTSPTSVGCDRDTDTDWCGEGQICSGGACVKDCSNPCAGKECGPSGCPSGECPNNCNASTEKCENNQCVKDVDKICGWRECDDYGGVNCGDCSGNDECEDNECVCQGSCSGKECGDNGCGVDCNGDCSEGYSCKSYKCEKDCSTKSYNILIVYPWKSIDDKNTASSLASSLKSGCNKPSVDTWPASAFESIDLLFDQKNYDLLVVLGAQLAWDTSSGQYADNIWSVLFDDISSSSSSWFQTSSYDGVKTYGCAGWDAADTSDVASCLGTKLVVQMDSGGSITGLSSSSCP